MMPAYFSAHLKKIIYWKVMDLISIRRTKSCLDFGLCWFAWSHQLSLSFGFGCETVDASVSAQLEAL
jgi:hypothetical protein